MKLQMILCNGGYCLKCFSQGGLPQYLALLCFCPCVCSQVFNQHHLSYEMYRKYCGNIWYVFPKFSEVICLPFLTLGVPHMACYLEFLVFRRQAIVAYPIESMNFVIFLARNDFLNVSKSHLNSFFLKVLVAFF